MNIYGRAADNSLILPDASPDRVLYYYDEPLTYAKFNNGINFVFHKIDERDGDGIFLVAPASGALFSAVAESRISLRSVFVDCFAWIAQVTDDFKLSASRMVHTSDIDGDLLPEANTPLDFEKGYAPDVIVNVPDTPPFLSFKFHGDRISQRSIPLNVLKGVIDDVYGSVRTIFIQPASALTGENLTDAALTKLLHIPVHQPVFASLRIDVEMPVIDKTKLRRKTRFDSGTVNDGLEEVGESIVSELEDVRQWLEGRNSNAVAASDQFHILEVLHEVVPKETSEIKHLVLQARDKNGRITKVDVNVTNGERIRAAHELLSRGRQIREGRVILVNQPSETFVIRTRSGRGITCDVGGYYQDTRAINLVSVGMQLRVIGEYTKRKVRDRMDVDTVVDIESDRLLYAPR